MKLLKKLLQNKIKTLLLKGFIVILFCSLLMSIFHLLEVVLNLLILLLIVWLKRAQVHSILL